MSLAEWVDERSTAASMDCVTPNGSVTTAIAIAVPVVGPSVSSTCAVAVTVDAPSTVTSNTTTVVASKQFFLADDMDQIYASWVVGNFQTLRALRAQCRYIIHAKLHSCIYGAILIACDTHTHTMVAIKVSLKKWMSRQMSHRKLVCHEDVRQEVAVMEQLQEEVVTNHAPFCHLLQVIEDDTYHYVVTELVPGGDLITYANQLRRIKGPFTITPLHPGLAEEVWRKMMHQLVYGLEVLQRRGLAHTDLSPENICVDQHGCARIVDFGLVIQLRRRQQAQAQQQPEQLLKQPMETNTSPHDWISLLPPFSVLPLGRGKIGYNSPELYLGQPWDAFANDVFSLGITMYCMLAGKQGMQRPTTACPVYASLISGKWRAHQQGVSDLACDLIEKMVRPQLTRITLKEILEHPWMTKGTDEGTKGPEIGGTKQQQ